MLNMKGEVFNATGRGKRNPSDSCVPIIGEELALARALSALERQIIDAAYATIDAEQRREQRAENTDRIGFSLWYLICALNTGTSVCP